MTGVDVRPPVIGRGRSITAILRSLTVTASGLAKDMGLPGHCSSHSQYTAAIEAELKKPNQQFLAGRLSDTQLALGVGRNQNMAREWLETGKYVIDVMPRFPKEMSHSRVLAFGLAKEGFHQCGQLLDSAQSADGQPFHLVLGLYEAFGDAALHVRPDLLVGLRCGEYSGRQNSFRRPFCACTKSWTSLAL